MDKAILKKFAIESRQDLMQKMESKIRTFYIDEDFSKNQSGDLYILSNDKHTLSLTKEEYEKRETLIKRVKELGIDQVIEESAYTWFNRIVAIRYMEINDYLPLTKDNQNLGIRVLSSKDNTNDPEILKFTNLSNPDLDIDFKKEKYVELKTDNDKFEYILLLVCRKLGKVIPQIFDGITDYIDILIPDNLLNDTGFVNKIIVDVPEDNYNKIEIIGWLYQYYNQKEKDRVMSEKSAYKKNEIPYATQLFTPDWIVKYLVENSLGRSCVENFNIKENNWEFFINRNINYCKNIDKITDLKFIDPCCGSGHILVYSFELLYDVYLQLGYNRKDITKLILTNNIYGIDIDDRAGQLSILSLILKAREYDKNIFNEFNIMDINLYSIHESSEIDNYLISELSDKNKEIVQYLIDKFQNAKEIGSLLLLENKDYSNVIKDIENNESIFGYELKRKISPLIKVAKILSAKYDVIVTNPPYAIKAKLGSKLSDYLTKKYNGFSNDLFTAFIKRMDYFMNDNSLYGMITPHSWMTLGDLESIRSYILNNHCILSMAHMGVGAFGTDFGTTSFIISNYTNKINSIFIDLSKWNTADEKGNNFKKAEIYEINQHTFLRLPNKAIAYSASEKLINNFNNDLMKNYLITREGMTTGCNDLFLRYWFEVENHKGCKWFSYNKGGSFRKWYGNNEYVVNWENDGYEIRNFKDKKTGRIRSHNYNGEFIKKEGITWGAFSSIGASFRYSEKNTLFDSKGSMGFSSDDDVLYYLGFLNTVVAEEYLKFISGTRDTKPGHISLLPIIKSHDLLEKVKNVVRNCIDISREDWNSFENSCKFINHPLIKYQKGSGDESDISKWQYRVKDSFESWKNNCNEKFNILKQNEEELNRIFIKIYSLQDELTPEVEDKDITIRKADRVRDIKSLISYAVGCMFGRYSLDEEGLIYAGGEFDFDRYKTFKADVDNIIPITDDSYFSDDIVTRFKTFIEIAYGKETINQNLDYIAESLGRRGTETSEETIRRYFINDFYNDHVKTYQKRPIYWLFDSGKKNGFKALIYMHRYNENTVPKVRLDYLHRIQTTYEKLLTDVNYKLTTELTMTDKKQVQNKQADLNAKLVEIKEYDEKIAHIANQRIGMDLDDGVKINYEKFADILSRIK